jgi:putative ABC transport system substrate-binding protein
VLDNGLVTSLARPGGNVTGLSPLAPELEPKRLQLLAELVPRLSKVAALWNPTNPGSALAFRQTESAARALSVKVSPVELQRVEDVEEALAKVKRERPDGLIVQPETVQINSRTRIIEFAAGNRLPAIYGSAQYTAAGGLIAYAPTGTNPWRRAASYIDRILKGARPADLPVELPTRFELVINLKTAKALGFTVPAALLLRADRLIE